MSRGVFAHHKFLSSSNSNDFPTSVHPRTSLCALCNMLRWILASDRAIIELDCSRLCDLVCFSFVSMRHVSSAFDFNRFGIQILAIFLWEAQYLCDGVSDEILLLRGEAGIGVFDHGGKVGASVGALIGKDQILRLCQMHSRTQSLHQFVQVL